MVIPNNPKHAPTIKQENQYPPGKLIHATRRIAANDVRRPAIKADPILQNEPVVPKNTKRKPASGQERNLSQNPVDYDRKRARNSKIDPQHQNNAPRLPKDSQRRESIHPESEPVTKRAKKQRRPRPYLWYGTEFDVLDAGNFNAGWSVADYGCKVTSDTSEEDDDDDDEGDDDEGDEDEGDDTGLSGRAPPSAIVSASTHHPRRSPRKSSPSPTATVTESSSRQSRRRTQIQVPPTEASKAQLDSDDDDDTDYDDDDDFSVPASPPTATVITFSRRLTSHHLIPTGTPVLPPSTATVNTFTGRKSRRQTHVPPTEASEAELDGDDDAVNADAGDLSDPSWENRLVQLADHRKIHGHCNVPQRYIEHNGLGYWVKCQRYQYKFHREGKGSPNMTPFHIQELESSGFEWDSLGPSWEDRLSALADYRKLMDTAMFLNTTAKTQSWGFGSEGKGMNTSCTKKGKKSSMMLSRIQALENLGFTWSCYSRAWEDRLSELADYRKIHGDCNVPYNYSEKSLAIWVSTQRQHYRWHREGEASPMTPFRIQELESMDFEWGSHHDTW